MRLKNIFCEEFDASESKVDTEYFGITSAKVILKKSDLIVQKRAELLNFLEGFEFTTIINAKNDPSNNYWLSKKTKAFLTDMNIQLSKEVRLSEEKNNNFTLISDNLSKDNRIIQLAETSFKYSRFLNDPYLPEEKAKHIYGDITKNAFGKVGRFFIIPNSLETIPGFLLFSLNELNSTSTIELIAIDQNYKGRGIGRSLLRSLEYYVCKKNIKTMKVGTQLDNIDALRFYTSYGFEILECNSIYHYWPLNS